MATTPPLYRYPLDPTGLSINNLVVGEEHQLSNRTVRCIAPTYGGFFADGVQIRDFATDVLMIRGTDYIFGELFEFPTGRYGKEIFGIIAITKPGVTKVKVTYQALGGDYSYSMDAIIAMIDNMNLGERPAYWPEIVGRPIAFEPASHFHDMGDIYGFEYITHSIDLLRQAILLGDSASHDEIYRYIDNVSLESSGGISNATTELAAHKADKANPHEVTKAQIGLGSVQNYGTATQAQMDTGTASNLYVTPAVAAKHVTDRAVTPLATHVARVDNPHSVTKAQVGLGSVQNFPIASTVQAQDGTDTSTYMTPRRVAEAISYQLGVVAGNHFSNINNPHSTTAAQVGAYTKAEVNTITGAIQNTLDTHTGSTANPHSTTAAQVGALSITDWNTGFNYLEGRINTKQGTGNYAVLNNNATFATLTATGNFFAQTAIYSSGDITAFWSDQRLKTNVRRIDSPLEKVRKIMGIIYTHNQLAHSLTGVDVTIEHMGVLAQQIAEVAPQVIELAPFDRDPATGKSISGNNYITVKYDKLVALLIEAVKELDEHYQKLEQRVAVLEI